MIHRDIVIQGDCCQALAQLAPRSAHFILTDPPYGVRYKARDGRTVSNDDQFAWLKPSFVEMYRVLAPDSFAVSFYGWPNADKFLTAFRAAGFRIVGHLVFPKPYTSGHGRVRYQHEAAFLLAKGNPPQHAEPISDVVPWTTNTGNKLHPTQKPIEILRPLIECFSQPGDVVLDPFAGSGSTLVAAKLVGRSYLGIELDAGYCAVAQQRLAQEGGWQ